MPERNTALYAVLALLPSPAFSVREDRLTWSNPAAEKLALRPGDALHLGEAEAEYRAWSGEGTLHFPLCYARKKWECSTLRTEEETLFLLQSAELPEDTGRLLAAAVRSVRPAFDTLKSAGDRLIPYLEEMEDPFLQQNTAPVIRAGYQLMRSISQLDDFCRLLDENVPLAMQQVELAPFFETMAVKAADIFTDCGLTLETEITLPENVFAMLDPVETERAVLCLLSNAAQFCDRGNPVRLRVTREKQMIRVTVISKGEPMNPEVLSTAFSRFCQPPADARSGAGLGLAAVQAIARRQGGSAVLSNVGNETTAVLTLRIRKPDDTLLRSPRVELSGGYDPALVEFSGILPDATFDSRNVDL